MNEQTLNKLPELATTPIDPDSGMQRNSLFGKLLITGICGLSILLSSCGGSGGTTEPPDDDSDVLITEVDTDGDNDGDNDPDGDGDSDADNDGDVVECSIEDQNQRVYDNMKDYYLFYDQVPQVNLADYDSPETLIRDLRVLPYDRFSFVSDASQDIETIEQGKNYGVGYNFMYDSNNDARIIFVDPRGPAYDAGFKRGDIILAIGGIPVDELTRATYDNLLGPREDPNSVVWSIIDGETNEQMDLTLVPELYDITTVVYLNTFVNPSFDGKTGYMVFTQFIETSDAELDNAFRYFKENEVTNLVVDLRYNRGGRTRIARKLASLIASPITDDELLIEYRFNDKYEDVNFARYFEPERNALGLESVHFITTGSTASSSEIVINSLSPYVDVLTIGGTTTGKPYISSGRDFCGKRMNALEAEGFNADDNSVYGGIPATCAATDDPSQNFGINNGVVESMLLEALDNVVFGTCTQPTLSLAEERTANKVKTSELSYQPNSLAEENFNH